MKDKIEEILNKICGRKILVVGDVMLDKYIWGDTSRISPEAPVPVVKVSKETYTAGGAANVAMNIASLGGNASLFGWIGKDENGRALSKTVEDFEVKIVDGAVSEKHNTIVKTRIVCRRQQVCRLDVEDGPEAFEFSPEMVSSILGDVIRESDAVIISDYAKGVITTESIAAIQKEASNKNIIALDPKPRSGIFYKGLYVMTPNRSEALKLAEIEDNSSVFPAEEVCERIYEKYAPEKLVVTLGADGMLIGEKGKVIDRVPTFAREVFDVSGAGDTVIAALTLALSANIELLDAIHFANTAAGFVVGKLGTATATPSDIIRYASGIVNDE